MCVYVLSFCLAHIIFMWLPIYIRVGVDEKFFLPHLQLINRNNCRLHKFEVLLSQNKRVLLIVYRGRKIKINIIIASFGCLNKASKLMFFFVLFFLLRRWMHTSQWIYWCKVAKVCISHEFNEKKIQQAALKFNNIRCVLFLLLKLFWRMQITAVVRKKEAFIVLLSTGSWCGSGFLVIWSCIHNGSPP